MDNLLNNKLKVKLTAFINLTQMELFRDIDEGIGALDRRQADFISYYSLVSGSLSGATRPRCLAGRPPSSRRSILKLFFMKAFLNLPTTKSARGLIMSSPSWRRVCGFESSSDVPSEATLSRAFAEFSRDGAMARIHSDVVVKHMKDTETIIHDVSGDSTKIEARERGVRKEKPAQGQAARTPRKRGRKTKEEKRNTPPPEPSRLELQGTRTQEENLSDIPRCCDCGCKVGSKGMPEYWRGFKLHIGVTDCGVDTAALLSSASLHDSQAAIPLMQMTAANTYFHFYDLLDAAYDSRHIADFSRSHGHVPIIDPNSRGNGGRELDPASREHYKCRTAVERVNSELKDSYGARHVMVRGAAKVFTHLMFGVVIVTVKHLLSMLC